jgi:hypothetical protein
MEERFSGWFDFGEREWSPDGCVLTYGSGNGGESATVVGEV